MQLFESVNDDVPRQSADTVYCTTVAGEGACSWPKNTTRDKRSDMINAAFVLAMSERGCSYKISI